MTFLIQQTLIYAVPLMPGNALLCGSGMDLTVRPRPSSRRRRRCTSAAVMYSAATNVNDARRAERLPGHQCFDY